MAAPSRSRGRAKRAKAGKTSRRTSPAAGAWHDSAPPAATSTPLNSAPQAPASSPLNPATATVAAAHLHDVIERELTAVERILDVLGPADAGDAECAARTLASLARTLREIALSSRGDEAAPPDDTDDDPIPRDIDEFRRELARRIHAFVDSRTGSGVPDQPEGALEHAPGARLD